MQQCGSVTPWSVCDVLGTPTDQSAKRRSCYVVMLLACCFYLWLLSHQRIKNNRKQRGCELFYSTSDLQSCLCQGMSGMPVLQSTLAYTGCVLTASQCQTKTIHCGFSHFLLVWSPVYVAGHRNMTSGCISPKVSPFPLPTAQFFWVIHCSQHHLFTQCFFGVFLIQLLYLSCSCLLLVFFCHMPFCFFFFCCCF